MPSSVTVGQVDTRTYTQILPNHPHEALKIFISYFIYLIKMVVQTTNKVYSHLSGISCKKISVYYSSQVNYILRRIKDKQYYL